MYENSKSSIDWKGLFLKVVIAFLVVLIVITGYKTFKGDNNAKNNTTTKLVEKDTSTTFTGNISKLKAAGEKYYKDNKDKLPKDDKSTTIVTLKELISENLIDNLTDENGKSCDIEGSYVTASIENKQTKLKANLVCGESSSYSIVYMGENDSETEKEEKTNTSSTVNKTSNKTYSSSTKKETTSNSTVKTSSSCVDCAPVVSVSTNTEVKNDITINSDKKENTNNKENAVNDQNNTQNNNQNNNYKPTAKYYTVTFDKNGGTTYYRSQEVKENEYAKDPGDNYKSGYYFMGWYLNGERFDFNTPITRDIELVAKYSRNNDWDDDWDNDWDDDYEYSGTDTFTTLVYTLGWDTKGTDELSITHTLRLPEDEIEDLEDEHDIQIEEIKIKNIEFYKPLTSVAQLNTYERKHSDTFIYKANGWEKDINKMSNLSTIKERDVDFDYSDSRRYVDIDEAEDNGFEVTWEADNVYKQCSSTFSVNGETNKCGYGIVYQVTWQYKFYR